MPTEISRAVHAMADELVHLAAVAADADDLQWEPSHTPTSREDAKRQGGGTHSDPTSSTALDERRLELRESTGAVLVAIKAATAAARTARHRLEDILTRWAGN